MHVIVSTIGTSLLSNQASPELRKLLTRTANLRKEAYAPADLEAVKQRAAAVEAELLAAPDHLVRRLSAELNGILGLDALGPHTFHYLLYTDTLQGSLAATLVAKWLRQHGVTVVPQVLEHLSTANREAFAKGIDALLRWCQDTLPDLRRQQARITFNLVGGFKSLHAYAHTLGMFYADEIVYIFEGAESELIRIPRLPLTWDTSALKAHAARIVRLTQGEICAADQLAGLPEAYLEIDAHGDATLSDWGRLAWNLHRSEILADALLPQPELVYLDSFRDDYKQRKDPAERVRLQEQLAKAAVLWREKGLAGLRGDHGLRYEDYRDHPPFAHFRVNDDLRVSCEVREGHLILRHFGPHDYVNDKP